MDIRPALDQYEESAFLTFVEHIWNTETNRATHDAWINHFNAIVGHPEGSDLLFYPLSKEEGLEHTPHTVVHTVKSWHSQQGRAAFKDQVLNPPATQPPREQQASQASERNLQTVRELAAQVESTQVEANMAALTQYLTLGLSDGTPEQQLTADLNTLRTLEAAQHQVAAAVSQLARLQLRIGFALASAQRDANSPFLDVGIQAVVLQEISACSQRHAALLVDAQARQPVLYDQAAALIEQLEARIAQAARVIRSGPGHGPLTLRAASETADLQPALLTARGLSRDVAQSQHALNKPVLSALAELEWQATALDGKHSGVYAEIAEFVLATPSEDPRFAFSVPLRTLCDLAAPDWQTASEGQSHLALPVRLCSLWKSVETVTSKGVKPFKHHSHVAMTMTAQLANQVQVRAAHFDASEQGWVFATEGSAPVSVLWQDRGRAYAPADLARPPVISFLSVPSYPPLNTFATLEEVKFDDYIVVFPPDAGIDPVYLMFRDRREF
ncbi:bacteriocin immunity protein [Pseudomonas sp.]|uniref:bacteriocin immunity protein n=1 Tax=Pseudomonas sp. TaxID=306 RepID=UPI0028AED635|nr:bacteriocin immunity protein [Pseudomonas sp.]